MKKIVSFLTALSICAATFTSCSDNDKNEQTPEISTKEGTIIGWSDFVFAYGSMVNNGDTVTYKKNSDDTYTLTFKSSSLGTAVFSSVSYNVSGNTITFNSQVDGVVTMSMHGKPGKDYACLLTSASVDASQKTGSFVISIPSVMNGSTITFTNGLAPVNKVFKDSTRFGGYSTVNCNYFKNKTNDKDSLIVIATNENTATVVYRSATWGSAKFENASISIDGNNYVLDSTNGVNGTITMASHGSVKDYDAILKSVSVNELLNDFSANVSVPGVMGGTDIVLQDGTAPASAE